TPTLGRCSILPMRPTPLSGPLFLFVIVLLSPALWLPASPALDTAAPLVTPYARHDRLSIAGTSLSSTNVPRYSRVEITVNLAANYDNPFDPDDIAVEALVQCPSGKKLAVPGFFTRDYQRALEGSREKLTAIDEGGWKVRLTPSEVGQH